MDHMIGKPPDGSYEWSNMHAYQSPPMQSPAQEYSGYGFGISPHEMPQESPFNRSHSLAYAQQQPQPVFPAQWPSMLASASMQQSSVPPPPQPPPQPANTPQQMTLQQPIAPHTTMTTTQGLPPLSTNPPPTNPPSRRTLTDQDRRRMCQFHEDNPSVKQTEIGAMFGVERSTVSKVLRQKEKYLFPEDGSRSPIKKAKGKFPDIERALSNWVRNHERKGLALSDKDIREKARFFAATVGSVDSYDKLNSASWLEKFKQKNGLLGTKARKPSDANESDAGNEEEPGAQTPSGVSPMSPNGGIASDSPISPSQSTEKIKIETSVGILGRQLSNEYNTANSQSATSIASGYSDTPASSNISTQPHSPGSSLYSSEASVAGASYAVAQQSQMMMNAANANVHCIRGQAFPVPGVDPAYTSLPTGQGGNITPKQMHELMAAQSLGTPIEEYPERTYSFSSDLHHLSQPTSSIHSPVGSGSPAIMAPPPNPLNHSQATGSPLGSPSQDEARRALELVMNFFQHQPRGVVAPEEYITMGKLMEKLRVQGSVGELPGGMQPIDSSTSQEVSRKRSIHSL